jgi:hypothetical protein
VYHASSQIFFPEETTFPGGTPPGDFVVVVEDKAIGGLPFRVVRWQQALEAAAKRPESLRLSVTEYSSKEGDPWGFKVTEQTPAHQVVSLQYRDMRGADTRYRVEGARITPLAYKTDGGMFHALALMPVFFVCLWLSWRAARFTLRKLSPR